MPSCYSLPVNYCRPNSPDLLLMAPDCRTHVILTSDLRHMTWYRCPKPTKRPIHHQLQVHVDNNYWIICFIELVLIPCQFCNEPPKYLQLSTGTIVCLNSYIGRNTGIILMEICQAEHKIIIDLQNIELFQNVNGKSEKDVSFNTRTCARPTSLFLCCITDAVISAMLRGGFSARASSLLGTSPARLCARSPRRPVCKATVNWNEHKE